MFDGCCAGWAGEALTQHFAYGVVLLQMRPASANAAWKAARRLRVNWRSPPPTMQERQHAKAAGVDRPVPAWRLRPCVHSPGLAAHNVPPQTHLMDWLSSHDFQFSRGRAAGRRGVGRDEGRSAAAAAGVCAVRVGRRRPCATQGAIGLEP
jgi:hypothetical protein